MLGDIHELARGLWLVEGEMPSKNNRYPDVANSLVYRQADPLYMIDTGVGLRVRARLDHLVRENASVCVFTLAHSRGHLDHVCNNDILHVVRADATHQYLAEAGLALLDAPLYFARHFHTVDMYFDPLAAFQADRPKWRMLALLRDALALLVGRQHAYRMLMPFGLRTFEPVHPSRKTVQCFESLPQQELRIGSVRWPGWVLGDNDV